MLFLNHKLLKLFEESLLEIEVDALLRLCLCLDRLLKQLVLGDAGLVFADLALEEVQESLPSETIDDVLHALLLFILLLHVLLEGTDLLLHLLKLLCLAAVDYELGSPGEERGVG